MNIDTRNTKRHIKDMAPKIALARIEMYKIPSPYSDVLVAVCVERKSMFAAEYALREKGMSMSQRTLSRVLKTGLDMFGKSDGVITTESRQEILFV